jgi:hypothetical protein
MTLKLLITAFAALAFLMPVSQTEVEAGQRWRSYSNDNRSFNRFRRMARRHGYEYDRFSGRNTFRRNYYQPDRYDYPYKGFRYSRTRSHLYFD